MHQGKAVDVVIAGSGIAGLTSALSAQEAGARVLVLEKAPETGGTSAVSGGTVWCAADLDAWLEVQPGGDPEMGRALIENFFEGIEWLRGQGVALEDLGDYAPYKFSRQVYGLLPDAGAAMETLASRFVEGGGTIQRRTALKKVEQGRRGEVSGVLASGPDGSVEIEAKAVVLATGGFQASAELRARHFGRWADRVVVRGSPYCTGDGFEAALEAGAGTAGPFNRFYGHTLPAPPAEMGLHNYATARPLFGEYGVLVNLNGERFEDEFLGDEICVHTAVEQPEATIFLIYDETVREKHGTVGPASKTRVNALEEIRKAGGEILEERNLEDLAESMASRWEVRQDRLLVTLADYNAACESGNSSSLSVPKTGGLEPVMTPPFYAIRLLIGMTFTYGGARVNSRAEVVDTSGASIRGLYAAGADVGGLYTLGYTGGLSIGLAYGRIAGKGAAAL